MSIDFSTFRHPEYSINTLDWIKWRDAYSSGSYFIKKYLRKFSFREDENDFQTRKDISYCPSFARAAIEDVKNSIFQRMADIHRSNGSDSYMKSIDGSNGGVDLIGSTMNTFMGQTVLPELLVMGKVGIFIDMPELSGPTIADNRDTRPYLYVYPIEKIKSWHMEQKGQFFETVLLEDSTLSLNEETGLPDKYETTYRRLWKKNGKVFVEFYNSGSESLGTKELSLPFIPFITLELSHSLMKDIADIQISLLNIASSDIAYILKSNFPFYVEQKDPRADISQFLRDQELPTEDTDNNKEKTDGGSRENVETVSKDEKVFGATHGRTYGAGLNQPAFIHPSSEPLIASMKKQEELKNDIRALLNLSIKNLNARQVSAQSKREDEKTLDSGLSNIGLTLEFAEKKIAQIWSAYENSDRVANVKYPINYSLKTEQEREDEINQCFKNLEKIPSHTYQKAMAKKAARLVLATISDPDMLEKIDKEIENAPNMTSDPEIIRADVELGLVSKELGSQLRGYPEGEVEKAKDEHAERTKAIVEAQAQGKVETNVRGVEDLSENPNAVKEERKEERDTTMKDSTKTPVRGGGRKLDG